MPRKGGRECIKRPACYPPRSTGPTTCRCTIPGRRCGCTRLARSIGDMRIFTVGHSNLEFEDFVEMIKAAGVTSIVDVRKLPGSRKYPWFNDDHLAEHLPTCGI